MNAIDRRMQTIADTEFDLALIDDVPELVDVFEAFVNATGYPKRGIVFDRDKAREWLERVIPLSIVPHLLAKQDGKIVGLISYGLDEHFCEKPIAVMHTIWVAPELRHSVIGRTLVALAGEMAIGDGACAFHAPIASELVEVPTLKNLFKHAGFSEIGFIMGRSL